MKIGFLLLACVCISASASERDAAQSLKDRQGYVYIFGKDPSAAPVRVTRDAALRSLYSTQAAQAYEKALATELPAGQRAEAEAALERSREAERVALADAQAVTIPVDELIKSASDYCSNRTSCSEPCCYRKPLGACSDLCLGTSRVVHTAAGRSLDAPTRELTKVSRELERKDLLAADQGGLLVKTGRLYETLASAVAAPAENIAEKGAEKPEEPEPKKTEAASDDSGELRRAEKELDVQGKEMGKEIERRAAEAKRASKP